MRIIASKKNKIERARNAHLIHADFLLAHIIILLHSVDAVI